MESHAPVVGIDLGTTFSVIACVDSHGRPETIANAEGERLTPSAVLFEGDSVVVGREAYRALATDAEHVAVGPKRELGRREYPRPLGGRTYPPEALQAWILNKLRLDASRQVGPVRRAVITVPAYFDEFRRKATQDAGYMAGLEVLDILNEPTAAALAHAAEFVRQSAGDYRGNLLVYDLGGGTFNVTVLEMDGRQVKALATDGGVRLGGDDWDARLLHHVAEPFRQRHAVDPRVDFQTAARWKRECEETKRTLSLREKAIFAATAQGIAWQQEISRVDFEELSRDLLDRTRFTVEQTVIAAGLRWSDIDQVLLAGGATRMPAVRSMIQEVTGREPLTMLSPDEAVAHGAALHARLWLPESPGAAPKGGTPLRIRNVSSHSLGVAGSDGLTRQDRTAILIPRNSPLPATARRVFRTRADRQRSIRVPIVEGESHDPRECIALGECIVTQLPPNLPAQSPVEVTFHYEENGRLSVEVFVTGREESVHYDLLRDNGLSAAQLDAWRQHIAKLPPS